MQSIKSNLRRLAFILAVMLGLYPESHILADNVPDYHKEVLENGATVVSCYMPDSSLVTVQVRVLSGLSNEGKYAGTGISHFIEHMIFRGIDKNGITPSRKTVKAIGGTINGSTGQDSAEYHITVPKEHFRQAMSLIVGMVMDPVFKDNGFEMERDVILKEMNMIEDNPRREQLKLLFERAYRSNVYMYPIIGYRELFSELEIKDLEAYHSLAYVPDRIVLGIAGGVRSDEAFTAANEILGGYNRGVVWDVPVMEEPRQIIASEVISTSDVDMGYIAIGFHSVSIFSRDLYSLDVASYIMGSGMDSLLYRELVQKKQILHSVSAFNLTPRFPGLFVIIGTGEPEKLKEAREEIFKIISDTGERSVTDEDLMKAKNSVVASYLRSHENTHGIVSSMTISAMFTGEPSFIKNYVEGIKDTRAEDVAKVIKGYLTETNSTTVYTVPAGIVENFTSGLDEHFLDAVEKKDMQELTLDNGLKLIAKRTGVMPIVSVTFASPGGLMLEKQEQNGISNIMSSLMLRGTKKRTDREIIPVIERMGGNISAFSGLNSVGLSMDIMSRDLVTGMEIFKDVLVNPIFPDDQLEREKKRVIAGIREQEKDIFSVAMLGIRRLIYQDHPYSRRIEGEIGTIEKLERSDLRDWHKNIVVPEGSVICVAGDIDTDAVIKTLSGMFSPWKGRRDVAPERSLPPGKILDHEEISMQKQQSLAIIGFRGVTIYDKRKYVLDVISALLSGRDGLLFDHIREDMGLAYSSGVSNSPNVEEGYFVLYTATTSENIDRARDKIFDVIDTVIAGEVTEEDIESSKKRTIADHARSMEGISSVASAVALGELYGLGARHYEEYGARINEVTRDDIVKVAGELLDIENAAVLEIRSEL